MSTQAPRNHAHWARKGTLYLTLYCDIRMASVCKGDDGNGRGLVDTVSDGSVARAAWHRDGAEGTERVVMAEGRGDGKTCKKSSARLMTSTGRKLLSSRWHWRAKR